MTLESLYDVPYINDMMQDLGNEFEIPKKTQMNIMNVHCDDTEEHG